MLSKRKFLVFINPVSGTKNKAVIRMLVEKVLSENTFPFEILDTLPSGKYEFLKEKIRKDNPCIFFNANKTAEAMANILTNTISTFISGFERKW